MMTILKAGLLLVLELHIFYCFGILLERMRCLPEGTSFINKILFGFMGYHFLFCCTALPCIWTQQRLYLLIGIWLVVLAAVITGMFILEYKDFWGTYQKFMIFIWDYKAFILPCIVLQAFLIYYAVTNGQSDIDARTYIGQVTSAVDTGQLSGIAVTTGQPASMIGSKRLFTTFWANSAVICKVFHMHPLIYCRVVRAAENVILWSGAVFKIFSFVYRNRQEVIEKAVMSTMLTQAGCFLFANSIYTSSRFLLYRAYEEKAYCAGTLILISILVLLQLFEHSGRRGFIMLFITMAAGVSICASAAFILPIIVASVLISYILVVRKWNYIGYLLLALLPDIIYILLNLSHFSGIYLEG